MNKLKKILILGIATLVLVGAVGFIVINKSENERPILFTSPTEWTTYRNANVEFKYPKDWVLSDEVPSNFKRFLKSGEGCEGIIFYNKENPDVVLIVQNQQRSMLQDYPPLFDCWAIYYNSSRQPSPSERNTEPVFMGGRTMAIKSPGSDPSDLAVAQMYGLKGDIVEQYEVRSNFESNLYQFSLIYPKVFSTKVQPIFDSIIDSVEYFKKDRLLITEPIIWKTFTNSKLGFSFEYPKEWGQPKEKIIDYAGGQNQPYGYVASLGKGYVLSFSNTDVYVVGQSADFAAGREFIHTDYKGDPKRSAAVISEVGINLTARCSEAGYPVGSPTSHVIKFNLPEKEISGVMFVFHVLSVSDTQKYNQLVDDFMKKEISCRDMWGDNAGGEKAKQITAKLIAKELEISEMLRTGENFDKESQVNLAVYNRILKSAKFVN